jgi:triosephosphate isomerase
MMKDAGASYCIVGHSERRVNGDTNAIVFEKVKLALAGDLIPIVCIGETERDPDARYLQHLRGQIASALEPFSPKERTRVIFAYEPTWAINKTADEAITPHDLAEMVLYIRKILALYLPGKNAGRTTILYGGSAEPENARLLAAGSRVDGFLVGHASVIPDTFSALVKTLV